MTGRKLEYWVIPPTADAEFVASREATLDTYATPYDSRFPVVCMDEQPIQLLKETRVPIPGTKEYPRRVDYEYERAGVASPFGEPLVGWRQVTAWERRTKADWAVEVAALLTGRYAAAETVIPVCDNPNAHTVGAFDEAFPPDQARDDVRRIPFVDTPEDGSWRNVAECESSAVTRQCVTGRRFGDLAARQSEIAAGSTRVDEKQRAVDWHFAMDKAGVKLKRLYPKVWPGRTTLGTGIPARAVSNACRNACAKRPDQVCVPFPFAVGSRRFRKRANSASACSARRSAATSRSSAVGSRSPLAGSHNRNSWPSRSRCSPRSWLGSRPSRG